MKYYNKKFLILGFSKSGRAVVNYLLDNGAECLFFEELKSEQIDKTIEQAVKRGAVRINRDITDDELLTIDACIISPGIPINHYMAVRIKKLGITIMGELEFGYQSLAPFFIAVTGTNGKTTTVSLIDKILDTSGENHVLVGNVGRPLTSEIQKISKETVCITEVSSFQLESVSKFTSNIACVLNIKPDHLERHYSMQNYVFLKKRILANQSPLDYSILNYDDKVVKEFESQTKGKIIWVSVKEKVNGAYLYNGQLFYQNESIIDVKELTLLGEHNVYNVLFAIAVAKIIGIENSVILTALKQFKGVRHRIELCSEYNGIKFFNDSKSTNTASTISAISAMKSPTILILGGSEKGESYDELFNVIKDKSVKHVVITGASRFNMIGCAQRAGLSNVTLTAQFDDAIKIAKMFAVEGDSVLLSPACASFDCFSGFEERGERFVKLVGDGD